MTASIEPLLPHDIPTATRKALDAILPDDTKYEIMEIDTECIVCG
jgi:hypothetical protein